MPKNVQKELSRIEQCVKEILEREPDSRESYAYLYFMALVNCDPNISSKLKYCIKSIPKEELMELMSPESVSRAARFVWKKYKNLRPSMDTQRRRNEMQDVYKGRYRES